MKSYRYIIIGCSAGGLSAAREIRRRDASSPLLLLSEERYPAYSRPLIAKHIADGRTIESMLLVPEEFYENHGIDLRLNTSAVRIDAGARTVSLNDGTLAHWDQLLLATGSTPIIPPLEGVNRKGVHTFTTYDDAQMIARGLPAVRHAVVIGGGFIGLSAADALRKRDIGVTIVEMQSRLLSTMLDAQGSSLVEDAVRTAGAEVVTSRRVVSINGSHPGSQAVSSVTLDDRTRIQCEMVIVAVGVAPRTELAEGIASIRRGILVDEAMRTSVSGIFACGDVCETHDFARDQDAVLAIWPNAVSGGAAAGASMAGNDEAYEGCTSMNAIPYFGLSIASAGVVEHDPTAHEVAVSSSPRHYTKVVLKDGIVIGMIAVGDTSKCGMLYLLMKHKVRVDGWQDLLVREDFGLLSIPESLWRDQVTAAG